MDNKSLTNWQVIKLCWQLFGGLAGVVRSGDFWLTVLVWTLCIPTWAAKEWWLQPISIIPNLLGFTLGGFAIFLGFGSDQFKELITRKDTLKSPYLSVSGAFAIIVLTQCLALLWALVADALYFPAPECLKPYAVVLNAGTYASWGLGYFLFLYGIVLSVRASLRIFRLSRWYNDFLSSLTDDRQADK